jgi:hypothetical protein
MVTRSGAQQVLHILELPATPPSGEALPIIVYQDQAFS